MKRYTLLLYVVVFLLGIFTIRDYLTRFRSQQETDTFVPESSITKTESGFAKVTFPSVTVSAEIADTPEKKQLGLSYRDSLAQDSGMLFVFEKPEIPFFWMKDMKIPLDIIWISEGLVVNISKNVPVPKEGLTTNQLPKYSPSEKVNFALEVNGGFADKNKIKIGDAVSVKF